MEIKQLIYFVTTAQTGSVNKTAQKLYTSQPSVSKSIQALEDELRVSLFERTPKGMKLTQQGHFLLNYAKGILDNAEIMQIIAAQKKPNTFNITSYPSKMIAKVFTDFYKTHLGRDSQIEYLEGDTSFVISNVENHHSEIGIVYLSEHQMDHFSHMLSHKNLEFNCLSRRKACIYVGPENPFYDREYICWNDLKLMRFIRYTLDSPITPSHDSEPMDTSLSYLGLEGQTVTTNSNHTMLSFLNTTELANFGLYFLHNGHREEKLRPIQIEGQGRDLLLGYVKVKEKKLSKLSNLFLEMLRDFIKRSDIL